MEINRLGDLTDIANLGLTLAETKRLLAGLQQEILATQVRVVLVPINAAEARPVSRAARNTGAYPRFCLVITWGSARRTVILIRKEQWPAPKKLGADPVSCHAH
jgi:hypothetical protein